MPASLNVQLVVKIINHISSTLGSGQVESMIDASLMMAPPTMDENYGATLALTSSDTLFDLTALPRTDQTNLDLTGRRVFGCCIRNLGANQMIFVSPAANNPYLLFNPTIANGLRIFRNGTAYVNNPAGYGTVGSTAKNIEVLGTSGETFEIILWAGLPAE